MRERPSTLVVGVGHDDRGDDGLGPLAARLLADTWAGAPPDGVRVLAWTGDLLALVECWRDVQRLVLIDAVVTGAAPGTLRRFAPDAPFATQSGASSHGFGVAAVLSLARSLDRLPPRVDVWGVEGARFGLGAPMSAAVVEAVLALVERLAHELGAPAAVADARPHASPVGSMGAAGATDAEDVLPS